MDYYQFYPTPPGLAKRAWQKFENTNFVRVLEPHGGNGDLAEANLWADCYDHQKVAIDCCEIDVTKHAVLRDKGFNVVGVDFLQFSSGSMYSHIIMNGPFSEGAKHVLKAFEILWDGEIAAIVNAETVRNPFSAERKHLVSLIERYGSVEFIQGAFTEQEAERKTDVEVALIHLVKRANVGEEIIGNLLDELQRDTASAENLAADFQQLNAMALPNSVVENTVVAFNAAVRSMREAVFAVARERYYTALLGDTMAVRNGDGESAKPEASVEWVQQQIGKGYTELKDRAWSGILRSSNVTSRLSSSAQRRVEKEFEEIKKLELTISNVYGFLCGIVESQGQLQIEMALDVFDTISRWHSENTIFFKGWKSNDRHRTSAYRVKTTRFVLPGHKTESWPPAATQNPPPMATSKSPTRT